MLKAFLAPIPSFTVETTYIVVEEEMEAKGCAGADSVPEGLAEIGSTPDG